MNNDELQKAIDDITNNNATDVAADTSVSAGVTAENEQLANELAQEAPATAAPEVADFAPAPAPAPEIPAEPAMPPMPGASVVDMAPAPEVVPSGAPMEVAPEAPASNDATLEEAMKELYPLLDKVELSLEEKFDITLRFGEPAEALGLAKQMTDETAKAKALVEIINKIK